MHVEFLQIGPRLNGLLRNTVWGFKEIPEFAGAMPTQVQKDR